MASSNTANWSVYSRNRKANVEELSWWFQGPKYLQFALRATRTHLTPTTYQQSRQLFIRPKLARQSKIRELLPGKNPKAATERGKMASDWPRCPSLNLPAQTRQTQGRIVVTLCSAQGPHLWRVLVPGGSRFYSRGFLCGSSTCGVFFQVAPTDETRWCYAVYCMYCMLIVNSLITKSDFGIIKALHVKHLCTWVFNLSFISLASVPNLSAGALHNPRLWPPISNSGKKKL